MSKWVSALALVALMGVACPAIGQSEKAPAPERDAGLGQIFTQGGELVKAGKPLEAIPLFDQVIAGYREKYKGQRVYCARTSAETLYYLMQASRDKESAKVVSSDWAYAHYLKAYALIELRRLPEARQGLEYALALSPQNSQFLSEMGYIFGIEKNRNNSIQYFQRAEEAAKRFSPEKRKRDEQARAMRGVAYNYIEQGKWDEAEAIYKRCLEMNPNDRIAVNQLEYIRVMRGKR